VSSQEEQKKSMFWATAKMAIATLASRILGLVREQVMASVFGAGAMTDAFLVAYRIPNLLRDLFAEGAFSSAFLPTFSSLKHKGKEHAREFLWAMFILLFIITGSLSLLIYIFSPKLIELFAPGFVGIEDKYAITVLLTKIMSPFLLLVSLAALFVGVLNSLRVFLIPSLAPAFFNLINIICLLVLPGILVSRDYPAVYALGWGVLIGGIFQFFLLVPTLFNLKMTPIIPKKIFSKDAKKVFYMLGPGLIGFAAAQINLLITTVLATSAGVGAVSWLSYSFRLFQFPVGVLGVSIANSNLVHFSDHWKANEIDQAKAALKTSFDFSLFSLLGAMALLSALSFETVQIIFQHGKFTFEDTTQTSLALQLYLLGLPSYGVYKIFSPIFYVLDLQKIPVFSSIISILINIFFSVLLAPKYGFLILALGNTLSTLINALILSLILNQKLKLGSAFFFSLKIRKIVFAAILCFLSVWATKKMTHSEIGLMGNIVRFLFLALLGSGVYMGLLSLLGEAKFVKNFWKKK